MNISTSKAGPTWPLVFVALTMFPLFGVLPNHAQTTQPATTTAPVAAPSIPSGTLLPVVLRTPLSFDKSKQGQILRGKIAQDVPLPNGSKIRKGSTIEGHVTQVTPNASTEGSKVTLEFDKMDVDGQWVPVVTNLRAIAGFMTVIQANIPDEAPAEGSPYNWLPKTQIGGDSVYGVGGPVMSAEDDSKVIGKSTPDGVLGQVSAREGSPCRGAVDGNNHSQALWVFSSDACGAYGIDHLKIDHSGRCDPKGKIILASDARKLQLRDGDGLLLRVN